MSLSITATIYYRRWAFLACALLASLLGFVLFSGSEEFLPSSPREGALLSVSEGDAQGIQDAPFYPAGAATLEAPMPQRGSLDNDTNSLVGLAPTLLHMPQRGSLDNDTDKDGQDDRVADPSVGMAPTLLLTPLLEASFVVPLYELLKMSSDYYPILERPG